MDRIAQFTALVARDPANKTFRFSLAKALLDAGRTAEALPALSACAEAQHDWMMPRILLGKALLTLGRPREARPVLEAALALAIAQDHEEPMAEIQALLVSLTG
jgi:predicted Zn-dependent protease